jgi:hypothetical protein
VDFIKLGRSPELLDSSPESKEKIINPELYPTHARAAMCMVGTAVYHVGRTPWTPFTRASTKAAGSNLGRHNTEALAAAVARIEAEMPPMWKRGIALRATSWAPRSRDSAMAKALAQRAPPQSGTTCGRVSDYRKGVVRAWS